MGAARPQAGDRVRAVDVARALGVLGVIAGHAWYGSALERVFLSFDLALFFFVGGYVYNESYSARPDRLMAKRLTTLYLPFIRWGLFWLIFHNSLLHLGIYSTRTGYLDQGTPWYDLRTFIQAGVRIVTFRGTEPMAGALWFLASLFIANVLFGLASFVTLRLFKRPNEGFRTVLVLILGAAGYLSNPLLHNRFYLGTSLVALVIFHWGVLYRRYSPLLPLRWYFAVAAGVAVTWAILRGGWVYFGANTYQSPVLLFTVVPAGIYASLYLSKVFENNRFLHYVGTNTIFIIATHFLAFKAVSLVQIWAYGYPDYYLAKYPVISGAGGW